MDDASVAKQIDNMVKFIQKEAREKADEILLQADEDAGVEKTRLVQTQRIKIQQEYQKKEKQLDLTKKIIRSNEVNKSRLEKLRAQEKTVQNVFTEAKEKLSEVVNGSGYKQLIHDLILQGLVQLDERENVVRCKEGDFDLVNSVLPDVLSTFKAKYKPTFPNATLTLDKSSPLKHTVGGVVLSALQNRIICNNTLEVRLVYAYEATLPKIRHLMFGDLKI